MKSALLVLAALLLASGCAAVEQSKDAKQAGADFVTGSRLPRKNNENYQGTKAVSPESYEQQKANSPEGLRSGG